MKWILFSKQRPKHLQGIIATDGDTVEFGIYRDPDKLEKDDMFGEWADFSFYDDDDNFVTPTHWLALPKIPTKL